VDRADRRAATGRKASRIASRLASSCANVNEFLWKQLWQATVFTFARSTALPSKRQTQSPFRSWHFAALASIA
jgi:hypothetical protein